MLTRRDSLFLATGFGLASALPAQAAKPAVFAKAGVALGGFDPVAYFTQDGSAQGKSSQSFVWNGATWHFASGKHKDMFAAAPERYAPQYGGYCAWAVSRNYTAATVPEAWHLHEGRLFLNYSLGVRRRWRRDVAGNVARGDANWPGVLGG